MKKFNYFFTFLFILFIFLVEESFTLLYNSNIGLLFFLHTYEWLSVFSFLEVLHDLVSFNFSCRFTFLIYITSLFICISSLCIFVLQRLILYNTEIDLLRDFTGKKIPCYRTTFIARGKISMNSYIIVYHYCTNLNRLEYESITKTYNLYYYKKYKVFFNGELEYVRSDVVHRPPITPLGDLFYIGSHFVCYTYLEYDYLKICLWIGSIGLFLGLCYFSYETQPGAVSVSSTSTAPSVSHAFSLRPVILPVFRFVFTGLINTLLTPVLDFEGLLSTSFTKDKLLFCTETIPSIALWYVDCSGVCSPYRDESIRFFYDHSHEYKSLYPFSLNTFHFRK